MKTATKRSAVADELFQNPMLSQTSRSMVVRKLPLAILTFLALAAVTLFYWWAYKKPLYGIDDANIYFVYMKHVAEGHGFVWNVGGERVEGFTSILWTLIGAACYSLTPAHFPLLLLALNSVLTFFTVYRTLLFVRRLNNTTDQAIALTDVVILAALFFPLGFIEWSLLTLMETGLWLFLIVNTTLLLCNRYLQGKTAKPLLFSVMLMGMVLTRPEGLLFGLLFVLLYAVQTYFEKGWRSAVSRALLPFGAYALTAAALISWRLSYFGYPFPNTYYAKVSGNLLDNLKGGTAYLVEFFYNYPHLIFIIGVLLFYVFVFLQKLAKERQEVQLTPHEKIQALLLTVIFAGLGAPVLTGGDHFHYSRFYQCIVPLVLIAFFNYPVFAAFFAGLQPRNKGVKVFATVITVIMLFFISKATWVDFQLKESAVGTRIFRDFRIARTGRLVAERLNHTFVDQGMAPSTGIIAAGGYGYAYKGNTVDLMGLNNTVMAHANKRKVGPRNHASFDIGGFWKLRPDMVGLFYGAANVADSASFTIPENEASFRKSFTYEVYKKIFDEPQFIETYRPALVKLKTDDDYLFAYYNKAFLQKLDTAKYEIKVLPRHAPEQAAAAGADENQ